MDTALKAVTVRYRLQYSFVYHCQWDNGWKFEKFNSIEMDNIMLPFDGVEFKPERGGHWCGLFPIKNRKFSIIQNEKEYG